MSTGKYGPDFQMDVFTWASPGADPLVTQVLDHVHQLRTNIYDEAIAILDGVEPTYFSRPDSTGEPAIWAQYPDDPEPVVLLRRYALPVQAYPLWEILEAALVIRDGAPR